MSPEDAEFADLIKRVQEGNKDAAAELHAVYGDHILRVVRKKLHDRLRSKFDSLDFVQDVWASFFTDVPEKYTFDTPEDLIAFLTILARNKVVQVTRMRMEGQKHNVHREVPLDYLPDGDPPAVQRSPSEILMGQ